MLVDDFLPFYDIEGALYLLAAGSGSG